MTIQRAINNIRNILLFLGTVVLSITGAYEYYREIDHIFSLQNWIDAALATFTILWGLALLFFLSNKIAQIDLKIENGIYAINVALLKSDIDRYYIQHINDNTLSDDEIKYVLMLQEKLKYYRVNSFSQRKIDKLLKVAEKSNEVE